MTQRDRIVLGVVAVLAVLAGFYMTVVKPANTEIADLDTQITAAEERRDTALADLRTASAAREQYKRDQATLAVLGKAVPADEGVPSLLYQLHKAARKAGVDFSDITVGTGAAAADGGSTGADASGLTKLPLTLDFDGTFFELDRFLREVHEFAEIGEEKVDVRGRLLTIDAIELTPDEDASLSAKLTVNAYVTPKEAADAAGSGTTAAASETTGSQSAGAPASGSGDGAATESTPPSTGAAQ